VFGKSASKVNSSFFPNVCLNIMFLWHIAYLIYANGIFYIVLMTYSAPYLAMYCSYLSN
jgi:hypothetical protein